MFIIKFIIRCYLWFLANCRSVCTLSYIVNWVCNYWGGSTLQVQSLLIIIIKPHKCVNVNMLGDLMDNNFFQNLSILKTSACEKVFYVYILYILSCTAMLYKILCPHPVSEPFTRWCELTSCLRWACPNIKPRVYPFNYPEHLAYFGCLFTCTQYLTKLQTPRNTFFPLSFPISIFLWAFCCSSLPTFLYTISP